MNSIYDYYLFNFLFVKLYTIWTILKWKIE